MTNAYRRTIVNPPFPWFMENPIRGMTVEDIMACNDASVLVRMLEQILRFTGFASELTEDWIDSVNARSDRINTLTEEVNRLNDEAVLSKCESALREKSEKVANGAWSLFESQENAAQPNSNSVYRNSQYAAVDSSTISSPSLEKRHTIYPIAPVPEAAHFTKASENICFTRIYENECYPPPALHMLDEYREDQVPCMKFYSYPEFFFDEWRKLILENTDSRRRARKKKDPNVAGSGGGGKRRSGSNSKRMSAYQPKGIAVKRYSREGQMSIMQVESTKATNQSATEENGYSYPSSPMLNAPLSESVIPEGSEYDPNVNAIGNSSSSSGSRKPTMLSSIPPPPLPPPETFDTGDASDRPSSIYNQGKNGIEPGSSNTSRHPSRSPTIQSTLNQLASSLENRRKSVSPIAAAIGASFKPPPPPMPESPIQEPSVTAKMISAVQLKKVTPMPKAPVQETPRDSLMSAIRNRENLQLRKVQVQERDALGRPVSKNNANNEENSTASPETNDETKRGNAGKAILAAASSSPANNSVAALLMRRAAMEASDDSSEGGSSDSGDWN